MRLHDSLIPRIPGRGFTVVEVSIVLVIVGLLAGAIVVGTSLVHASRIRSTLAQLTDFTSQVRLFKERYGYYPGDYPEASTVIKAGLCNGNGDGATTWSGEAMIAWMHLYHAGLSTFQTPAWNCLTAAPAITSLLPPSKLSTNGLYYFLRVLYPYGWHANHFLIAKPDVSGAYTQNALTSQDTHALDAKMDDGIPNRGLILASGAVYPNDSCLVSKWNAVRKTVAESYDLKAESTPQCRLYYVPFE